MPFSNMHSLDRGAATPARSPRVLDRTWLFAAATICVVVGLLAFIVQ